MTKLFLFNIFTFLLFSLIWCFGRGSEASLPDNGQGSECQSFGFCEAAPAPTRHGVAAAAAADCQDLRPYCAERMDTCQSNWKFMHPHCPKTCRVCHNLTRTVAVDNDGGVAFGGSNPRNIMMGVTGQEDIVDVAGSDMGVGQVLDPHGTGEYREQIVDLMDETRYYMEDVVMKNKRYEAVRTLCKNKVSYCAFFAVRGECENNPSWMDENCAPVCKTCEELHIESRCPLDPNMRNAWYPGDLNKMFERIVSDPDIVQRFQPKVWARPTLAPDDVGKDTDEVDYLIDSPWVVTLENFVNATEAQIWIDHGGKIGYHRSADVGELREDGTFYDDINEGRTSENAWCEEECSEDPVTLGIMERIEYVTRIPKVNSESIQLLRYYVGQHYGFHHDFIGHEVNRQEGPRILTVFLYLNDVEEGGHTSFVDLDIKVEPKLGRALLWPSVRNDDPHAIEPQTHHEALPVIRGVKYGANAWFHLRDIVGPAENGC